MKLKLRFNGQLKLKIRWEEIKQKTERKRNRKQEKKNERKENGKEKIQHTSNQHSKMKNWRDGKELKIFQTSKKEINPQSKNTNKFQLIC